MTLTTGRPDRERTALHEAGHVVAALLLGAEVTRSTIARDRERHTDGLTTVRPDGVPPDAWCCIWAAGAAAEIIGRGRANYKGAGTDFDRIRATALASGRDEAEAVTGALQEAQELLRGYWPDVQAFQRRLLESTTLEEATIRRVARTLGLRPQEKIRRQRGAAPAGSPASGPVPLYMYPRPRMRLDLLPAPRGAVVVPRTLPREPGVWA